MKRFFSMAVAVVASLVFSICASAATNLDDLSTAPAPQTTASAQQNPTAVDTPVVTQQGSNTNSNAEAVGSLFEGLGVDEESAAAAKEMVSPVVYWVNRILGVLTALLGIMLLVITILDLIYIVSPSFIRNIGGNKGAASAGGMGMGMGMGAAQPQVESGFASLISDDCKSALAECGAGGAAPVAGGMPAGGMGMGGMGMGGMPMGGMGMGMGAPAAPAPSKKAVIMTYFKKRVFTFVLVGICAIVLTCTCFLEVGDWIGMKIVNLVTGITG